jgi:hypothetical protein
MVGIETFRCQLNLRPKISIAAEDFLNNNILGADFYVDGTLEQRKGYSPAVFSSDLTALIPSSRWPVAT